MSIKVAVFNNKGGVGKTTLSIILTQIALMNNKKVLAFDQDEQLNFYASMSYLKKEKDFQDLLTLSTFPLKEEDFDLPADLLIIDCPPGLDNSRTKLALKEADFILIPVRPDSYSIMHMQKIITMAGDYKELFQFPLIKVGFTEGSIHNKSLAAKIISDIISEKGYSVIGDVPVYDRLRASLSCGLKKWWSVGLTASARAPFELIYKRLELLSEKLYQLKKSMVTGKFQNMIIMTILKIMIARASLHNKATQIL